MKKQILETDRYSPLYKQLIRKLRDDIYAGLYPVHTRIPSEQDLCESYGVSRVTVRKALGELTRDGLLTRCQGKGTFVSLPKIRRDLQDVNSFQDTCRMMGCEPSTQVIHTVKVHASTEDTENLMLDDGGMLIEIKRLRMADGMPVMLETNRFPESYDYLMEADLTASLYTILKEHGTEPGQAIHDISLCYAAPQEARWLGVEPGTALLYLHEVIFDKRGHALHVSEQFIRGDRFTFRI